MTLNLTMGHLVTFVALTYFAAAFFKGLQLIRMIAWIGLWQLLTPVRGFLEDSLMLGAGFWIVEYSYHYILRKVDG